jgi:hypothetical protein
MGIGDTLAMVPLPNKPALDFIDGHPRRGGGDLQQP